MDFTTNWPKACGYYWFIDTEYPQPCIGYVMHDRLHYGQHEYKRALCCLPGRPGIRIGDEIKQVHCTDVRIVE